MPPSTVACIRFYRDIVSKDRALAVECGDVRPEDAHLLRFGAGAVLAYLKALHSDFDDDPWTFTEFLVYEQMEMESLGDTRWSEYQRALLPGFPSYAHFPKPANISFTDAVGLESFVTGTLPNHPQYEGKEPWWVAEAVERFGAYPFVHKSA